MTMNHPDITLYGTDSAAHRRRMVRDLELFLGNALAAGSADAAEHRERDDADVRAVYSHAATATLEDPRC
jgi:hypothetical protein